MVRGVSIQGNEAKRNCDHVLQPLDFNAIDFLGRVPNQDGKKNLAFAYPDAHIRAPNGHLSWRPSHTPINHRAFLSRSCAQAG